MPRPLIIAAAATLLASVGTTLAASEFNIIAQNRQTVTGAVVTNTTTGQIDSDEQLAEPFGPGPWQGSVESPAQLGGTTAYAAASQDSLIDATILSGTGSIAAILSDTTSDTTSQALALSAFASFFSIGTPTLITFNADISDTTNSFLIFEGPGGIIAELSSSAGTDLSVDLTVLLAPGNYALNASAGLDILLPTGATGVSANSSWNFELAIVPGPTTPALALLAAGALTRRRR